MQANQALKEAFNFHIQGRLDEAEKLYLQLLKKTPDDSELLNLTGLLKLRKNQPEDALSFFKKAFEINPNSFEIRFNLALAYKKNNETDKAVELYKKALEIDSSNYKVYFNLGHIFESKNETATALEYYKKAYEYSKDEEGGNDEITYFLALSYMKMKNYTEGLIHYEARPSKKFAILSQELQYKEQIISKPFWSGTEAKDKTIFVYYESALGDTLMYSRYLKLLKDKFKKVLFKPQVCLMDFFKENNFGAEIIDLKTHPDDVKFDFHLPIMSLPYALNLMSEEIPFSEGYLKANLSKIEKYKEEYFNNDKFKIGIKWMGNPTYETSRIINIEAFYDLFEIENTQFYSLQKGDGIEELEKIPSKYNVIDLGKTFEDFTDTAAAIENLDLVICNDTSIAHLAGAMGKHCWILLPFVQNWRWHTDISYSPWYKSVKLYKQIEPENWGEVFERIKGVRGK